MKTKDQANELMIWLPKLSAGKTLEAVYKDQHAIKVGARTKILDIRDLISFIESGNEIRIKAAD